MNTDPKIGFIGAGKMACALARGFCNAKIATPSDILASDPQEGARAAFEREVGARTTESNIKILEFAQVVILAVKPIKIKYVLDEINQYVTKDHLIISIAAGITLKFLQSNLPAGTRVIRVMPNTPALVGAGASAYATGINATRADEDLAHRLLSSVGLAVKIDEELLDAVTGLSGSGPAFIFLVIEAMSDGAISAGLPRDIAIRLASATVLGAGKMVLETGMHPAQLKDMVTSPAGTTIDGIYELEKNAVRSAFMSAVKTAAEKSKLLSRQSEK